MNLVSFLVLCHFLHRCTNQIPFIRKLYILRVLIVTLSFTGGLQAIGELLQVDCEIYGLTSDHYSVTLRRYAGMALTNLTFGDVANKVLCSLFLIVFFRQNTS